MTDLSHIYKKLHETRWYHVEQARKARDMQERIAELEKVLEGTKIYRISIATRNECEDTPSGQDQMQSE